MCHYMAFHLPAPKRIDHPNRGTNIVYNKLVNYFMMRALDMNYRTRILAHGLNCVLHVLEKLSRDLTQLDKSTFSVCSTMAGIIVGGE
jgi:hypothetical protein